MSERVVHLINRPGVCPRGHCDAIAELLSTGPLRLSIRTTAGGPPPHLVVRQIGPGETIDQITLDWRGVPALGIFCGVADGIPEAVRLTHSGLSDFCLCPARYCDVWPRVLRLLSGGVAGDPEPVSLQQNLQLENLVGQSKPFLETLARVAPIARADATVLLTGETGTGKECLARAIHYRSVRANKPFIAVNCGALPANLIENELFGHVRGAYTDARDTAKGLISAAEKGTLLLDEVDALPLPAQATLLRFLQDKEYRPVGSAHGVTANVRVIAATNADLRRRVAERSFRDDLFHRLNILSLHIPPLRERPEDVVLLAAHFLARDSARLGRHGMTFAPGALDRLAGYEWPGNIRELEAVIQRAVVMSPGLLIREPDFQLDYLAPKIRTASMREAKREAVSRFERTYLTQMLAEHQGNISWAARAAGKERRAFQRLIRKHGLTPIHHPSPR